MPGGLHFELADVAFVLTPLGLESPTPADMLRVLPSISVRQFASSAVDILGDDLDRHIATFLTNFTDPVNDLPYSSADGGYQWLVQEWDTEEAVDQVFSYPLEEDTYNTLVLELNRVSTSWVSVDELDRIYE